MFKHSMMFHNSGKQPVQAHQFNVFSNQMSPVPATPSTPTPSCTNNTAINLPATPEFANNQKISYSYKHKVLSRNTQ